MTDRTPEDLTLAAVANFWKMRDQQIAKLADGGKAGGAARADRHLHGLRDLVKEIFLEAGIPAENIKNEVYLPGYYRVRKRWDLVVTYKGTLVAALELKSQVGAVGKNMNNRFEEALGTGTDTWAAQHKLETFGEVPPWLGYVLILREDEETETPDRDTKAVFPVDETFIGMSYNQRYQEMIKRFMGDNIYQAGWFITTKNDPENGVSYAEPLATATSKSFKSAVQGRVDFVKSVLG